MSINHIYYYITHILFKLIIYLLLYILPHQFLVFLTALLILIPVCPSVTSFFFFFFYLSMDISSSASLSLSLSLSLSSRELAKISEILNFVVFSLPRIPFFLSSRRPPVRPPENKKETIILGTEKMRTNKQWS